MVDSGDSMVIWSLNFAVLEHASDTGRLNRVSGTDAPGVYESLTSRQASSLTSRDIIPRYEAGEGVVVSLGDVSSRSDAHYTHWWTAKL